MMLPYINLHIFPQKYNQRLLKVTQVLKQTPNPYLSVSPCMNYYHKAVLAFIIFLKKNGKKKKMDKPSPT